MARRRGWVWLAVLGVVALAGAIGPSLLRAQEDAGSAEQDGADGGEAAPDGGGPAAAEAEAAEEDEDSGPAVDVTVGVYAAPGTDAWIESATSANESTNESHHMRRANGDTATPARRNSSIPTPW